jgi:hypothetical protein
MREKLITEKEHERLMFELGFILDNETGKFFDGESAYLGVVDDGVNSIDELIASDIERNPAHPSSYAADMQNCGAELFIGKGGIDDFGHHHKKGLYCSNYKTLVGLKNIKNGNILIDEGMVELLQRGNEKIAEMFASKKELDKNLTERFKEGQKKRPYVQMLNELLRCKDHEINCLEEMVQTLINQLSVTNKMLTELGYPVTKRFESKFAEKFR